jgi:acyl-CoA thioesterase
MIPAGLRRPPVALADRIAGSTGSTHGVIAVPAPAAKAKRTSRAIASMMASGPRSALHRRRTGAIRLPRVAREGIDDVSRWMGMRWDDAETVRVQIRPELINAGGLLSGAVTYAMVDYCMGSTLWKETTEDEAIATVNISINYVATATEGEAICHTTLDRRNRRLGVLRSEVKADDGRLLATAIGSYTIFPREKVRRAEG